LTKADRSEIEILRTKNYTLKEIAKVIGVVPSAIWYELKKRTRKDRVYDAVYAQHRAYVVRKYARAQGRTIALNKELRRIVEEYLFDDQSPENIAGRITKHHRDLPRISGRLIRRYIASPYGRKIESHRKKLFRKYRKRWKKRVVIDGRRMISKRSLYINT
jgi:IS30 family transposase